MKICSLMFCIAMIVVCLSYVPADAQVYRSRSRAACSGVSAVREYSRSRAASCSGGVSRSRARARSSCSGL